MDKSAPFVSSNQYLPILRLDGLCTTLAGPFDLELSPGECLTLSGPSGVGKSLLLRAIADLDPNRGEVWLEGKARSSIPAPQWRRRVGLLPAECQWWRERVDEHFDTDPAPLLARLGLDTSILKAMTRHLSSGESQRLGLLRLMGNRPRVLLLDEPTASLDPGNVRRLEQYLMDYLEETGGAAIWISHDPGQIERVADRRAYLDAHGLRLEAA